LCTKSVGPRISNRDAPKFADIANRAGMTGDALAAWLKRSAQLPGRMGFRLEPQAQLAHTIAVRSARLTRPR
jgi:hypothetical protein